MSVTSACTFKCPVCKLGKTNVYTCPRCGIFYCSVVCFQKHSPSCVDAFRKETEESALKGIRVSAEDAHKFVKMTNDLRGKLYRHDILSNCEGIPGVSEDRMLVIAEAVLSGNMTGLNMNPEEVELLGKCLQEKEEEYASSWKPWWGEALESCTGNYNGYIESTDSGPVVATVEHVCCKGNLITESIFQWILEAGARYVLLDRYTLGDHGVVLTEYLPERGPELSKITEEDRDALALVYTLTEVRPTELMGYQPPVGSLTEWISRWLESLPEWQKRLEVDDSNVRKAMMDLSVLILKKNNILAMFEKMCEAGTLLTAAVNQKRVPSDIIREENIEHLMQKILLLQSFTSYHCEELEGPQTEGVIYLSDARLQIFTGGLLS